MDKLPPGYPSDSDWLEGFLTTRQASQLTGISEATLVTWRSRGGGPPFSKVSSLVRYRRRSLFEFMRQREQKNTAEHALPTALSGTLLAPASTGSDHD